MTVIVCLLPLADTSALRIQLQLIKLPLVEPIHCHLRRQDCVEIVARPLHPALVEITAVLHSDETHLQKRVDTFHCGILCQPCHSSNGVIAGVTGVRLAILDVQRASWAAYKKATTTREIVISCSDRFFGGFEQKQVEAGFKMFCLNMLCIFDNGAGEPIRLYVHIVLHRSGEGIEALCLGEQLVQLRAAGGIGNLPAHLPQLLAGRSSTVLSGGVVMSFGFTGWSTWRKASLRRSCPPLR